MAGRTSTSFGVGATITILAVASLGFFIAFAVFYGKHNEAQRKLQTSTDEQGEFVKAAERNRDDVRALVDEAKKAGNKSLVGYLIESQEAIMQRVTGARRDKPSDLANKIDALGDDAKNAALLSLATSQRGKIGSLEKQLEQAEAARVAAAQDQQNEVARVRSIEESHAKTIEALNAEVAQLKGEIEGYRSGTESYKTNVDKHLDSVKQAAAEMESRLKGQIDKLNEDKLILENQLASLRGQKNLTVVRAGDEGALVDAEVVGINSATREVFLSIGRKQNVVLGMTFSVYSSAAAIRPDAEGNYPRGKATLEVTNVGEATSTCRVTSEVRGNPVVKGDVAANAVYDPRKVYTFVVYGLFDTDRDGLASALERTNVTAMIQEWGGQVIDELAGNADFLVLGQRPVLPARPGATAPLEFVQDYIRRQKEVDRYDNLLKQAVSTSVPVLNENRLYTLVGKAPAAGAPVARP